MAISTLGLVQKQVGCLRAGKPVKSSTPFVKAIDLFSHGPLDHLSLGLVDLLSSSGDHPVRVWVHDVLDRHASENAVTERLDHLAGFDERLDLDAVGCSTVKHQNDRVLGHVDEPSVQAGRVGRPERRVGDTLGGTGWT
jgi:hypothetical protein